jgi:hypothetical protein
MQAFTSGLRARATLLGRNQMGLHQCVINGLDHNVAAGPLPRRKQETMTRNTRARRRNYDAGNIQSAPRRFAGGREGGGKGRGKGREGEGKGPEKGIQGKGDPDGNGGFRETKKPRCSKWNSGVLAGGSDRRRSGDLSIFSRTLYQLSYRA